MKDERYLNRELDNVHQEIREKLDKILLQTTEHNHRLSKVEIANIKRDLTMRHLKWTLVTLILPIAFMLIDKFL